MGLNIKNINIKEVIQKRYSCRSYRNAPVPDEKLKSILEVAQFTPSASNRQPYKFIIIKDRGKREKLEKEIEENLKKIDF